VVCLVTGQALASILLPKSFLLTAFSDWIIFILMVSASLAFTRNAFSTGRQQRLVWILLGAGYAIEAGSQLLWMHWALVVKQTPIMSLGDAGIYLAWTALILAFALRPHVELTPRHQQLGTLDLLLLLLWGLYLYLFLVIPWQYLAPEPQSYAPAHKYLVLAQDMILLAIVLHGWLRSWGRWRYFYALLTRGRRHHHGIFRGYVLAERSLRGRKLVRPGDRGLSGGHECGRSAGPPPGANLGTRRSRE
jgi:hypothetical protein